MKVRIHYHRSDNNYTPWNVWLWPENYVGWEVKFSESDDYGRVATAEIPGNHKRVGFVIHSYTWDKDIAHDRYIENFVEGEAEVWLRDGDPTVYTAPPADLRKTVRSFARALVTVHYYRYDQDYTGWNLWVWRGEEPGWQVDFSAADAYGVVARVAFDNITDLGEMGFVVRRSAAGNPWAEKDGGDRFVPFYHLDNDGQLHIWLMQQDRRVYYSPRDVDRVPRIVKAQIDEEKVISIETNIPVKLDPVRGGGFRLFRNDEEEPLAEVITFESGRDGAKRLRLASEEHLDLEAVYTVSHPTHGTARVTMGRIFDTQAFAERFTYEGNDLGAVYSPEGTKFRVWAPTAEAVTVLLYKSGQGGKAEKFPMRRDVKGTWVCEISGDLHGRYYTYLVTHHDREYEVVDPYARACGVNGKRGMVVDLSRTNPPGWERDQRPSLDAPTDAVIYELHVRDFSIHPASGISHKGKYLGVVEPHTRGPDGVLTGLAHLKELGITHLHLLPVFDFISVDESRSNSGYNWGYDPLHYNVPEGSYASDPYHGEVRIREFKEMVQGLHRAGIRVIMDVVYNHTAKSMDSNLNLLVPGYYYRLRPDGHFSNGSGCGNELADERSMVRKFIVHSVTYWAREYKIDGFRFDLMGLHHVTTMKAVRKALNEIDPSIIIYGEGWAAADSTLPGGLRALKSNTPQLKGIASFSNDMRDAVKGHVFHQSEPGFVQGAGYEEPVKFGIVAATYHEQVDYLKANHGQGPWAVEPGQCITYAASHDNLTLWDKLSASAPDASEEERIKMQKLANALVLTSQGIPFLHAGQEFARTKEGEHNSYQSPDRVNRIDWSRKVRYREIFDYTKGLIALRKAHPAFRMRTSAEIRSKLTFIKMPAPNMVGYFLGPHAGGDPWGLIAVLFNANPEPVSVKLNPGRWGTVVDEERAELVPFGEILDQTVVVAGRSCRILVDLNSISEGGV